MLATHFTLLAAGLVGSAVAQNVLFVDTLQELEYTEATQVLGYNATVVTEAEFSNMTTSEFAVYDALIFSDASSISQIQFITDARAQWTPAIEGNIIIIGTDPSNHGSYGTAGAVTLIDDGLRFAVNGTSTGLFFSFGYAYQSYSSAIEVDALAGFGEFTSYGAGGCYNDVHLVADSPALNGLSDEDLSNWGCSIHEVFASYPSDFSALAIANGATGEGAQTFADNSTGIPYILARGVTPSGCGNGVYESVYGEECDDGDDNGTDGDLCSSACRCIYGVEDALLGTCNSPPSSSSSVSSTATSTGTSTGTSAPTSTSSEEVFSTSTYSTPPSEDTPYSSVAPSSESTTASSTGSSTGPSTESTTESTTATPTATPTVTPSSSLIFPTLTLTPPSSSFTRSTHSPSFGNGTFTATSTNSLSASPSESASIAPSSSLSSASAGVSSASESVPGAPGTTSSASETTTGASETTSSAPASASTSAAADFFPDTVGAFSFLGCLGSEENFPSYSLILTSQDMDIEMCTSACADHVYAGLYDTECFCADLNTNNTVVAEGQCNLPCPGDETEHCGGISQSSRLARRQAGVPDNALLTAYVNTLLLGVAPAVTSTVTAVSTAVATETSVVASVSTITSCAPGDTACHIGSLTTATFTTVTTAVSVSVSTTTICVSGYCNAAYIFEVCNGTPAADEIVFVIEACSCRGGHAFVPAPCSGEACSGLTVYRPVPCSGSTPGGAVVYQPQACDHCSGGVTFIQAANSTATGGVVVPTPGGSWSPGTSSGGSSGGSSGSASGSAASPSKTTVVVVAGGNNLAASFASLLFVLGAMVLLA
ncbi:hypothetical protein NKR23_g9802 [Pleurostoma richardsiae]|uniref:WSC domain-containing protein n=1 Tax=Pleurostoma richardsiae TaxID=41990 RepID=A0AA38R6B9_9PEZI|nr:hypothetical protein NKR23_g9802 [Pleurostoma richardsiae]